MILLGTVASIIPSIKMFGDVYYTFAVYTIILFIIFLILLCDFNIKIKLAVIFSILILYRKNIYMTSGTFYTIIKEGYFNSLHNRKDDKVLRDAVYKIFNKNLKLKLDFSKLPDKPTIIVCNYCTDRLENLACILIPKDIAILMRDTLKKISKLHRLIKWPIYTKEKNSYENTKKEVCKNIKEGRSVFSYITKTPRLGPTYIQNIRTGMFKLAKELNVPVTLIAIDYIDSTIGMIKSQNFNIVVGDTYDIVDINDSVYRAKKFFKDMLCKFAAEKYI
jgi:hypothetical protein